MLTLQLLINGLALGAAYALCALGFVLIVNATGAVNFAQGHMVVAGGYAAIALGSLLPVPGVVLLPAVVVLTGLLGLALSGVAYFPLKARPPTSIFISTIAIGIILENSATLAFGPEPRAGPTLIGGASLALGSLVISAQAAATIVIAAAFAIAQHWLLMRTRLGQRLRATAQDRETAEALGIRVNAMIALTFAMAAGLAGVTGLLLANTFFVTPSDGGNYILKAYIAATIGGWGRIGGAVAGAMLIALFEVLFPAVPLLLPAAAAGLPGLFSQTAATIVLYLVLLAILFFRPSGLFGETAQYRA